LQVESDLKTALATLTQTQQNKALLDNALRQQAEAAYQSALAAYQNSRGDLTAVIEAAHQQVEINLQLLRAQSEEQSAFASIERLAGGSL
jgi:outer membrane protein TolC